MNKWIQVYTNCPTHKKAYALADLLKISQFGAVGLMVMLWAWVAENAPDGDISEYPPRAIAVACGWTKSPATLFNGLVAVGLLDKPEDGCVTVHNWDRHELLLIDAVEAGRAKTRDRVKRFRDKKKAVTQKQKKKDVTQEDGETVIDCNGGCNVTVTQCNAPTKPNQTKPNQTIPKREPKEDLELPQNVADFGPPTQDEVMAFCRERGSAINPLRFFSHYDATGWKLGGVPIENWKALVVKWEASEGERGKRFDKSRPSGGKNTLPQMDYSGELEMQALADLEREYYANNGGAEGIALAGSDDTGSARFAVSCRAGGGIGGD